MANTQKYDPRQQQTARNQNQPPERGNTGANVPQGTSQLMRTNVPGRTQPNVAQPTVPAQNANVTQPAYRQPTGNTQRFNPTQPMPTQRGQAAQTGNTGRMPTVPYNPYGQSQRIEAPIPQNMRSMPIQPVRPRSNAIWIMGGAIFLGLLATMAVAAFVLIYAFAPDRIPSGVSVAGVDIGGDTLESARGALVALPEPQITLVDGARSFSVQLSDLGGAVDVDATIDAAQNASNNSALPPQIRIDLAQTQFGLVALTETINIDAIPGQAGRSMEIPVMLDRLRADPTGELADGIFELNMIDIEPPPLLTGANADPTARVVHVVEQGQELALIAREYGVSIDDIMQFNDIANPDLIYPGQELIVPAGGEYIPAEIPAAPRATGKSIVVSTADQRIYAYENGQLVRTHLTSTGLAATPTVLGDYSIYVKYQATDMSGPGYFLPQVPYTMYFYQGYGIHGTYWHNSFGRPMSHGCVNLPTEEALWFFNWAEVGTPVRVI